MVNRGINKFKMIRQSIMQVSIQRVLCAIIIVTAGLGAGAPESSLQQLRSLEEAAAANPNEPSVIRDLAHAYALALLQPDRNLAEYASAALDTSKNFWILGNAAYMLQCQYNETLQRRSPNELAATLAERYFMRARSFDPKLDRSAILPQIDLEQIAQANEIRAHKQREWHRRIEEASKHIRRLGPDAFPNLPPAVAAALHARNCTVPQPAGGGSPRNVIRGEFFESGQESWAALCSVNGWSTILAFRNAADTTPQSLARAEDRNYLQSIDQSSVGYFREIRTVARDVIVEHNRGYSVAKPPRIDHHGIDNAFLEKGSEVWYFLAGNWSKLPGSD